MQTSRTVLTHSYSTCLLVQKQAANQKHGWVQVSGKSLQDPAPWGGAGTLGHALLEPTLIYVKRLLALTDAVLVKVSTNVCVPAQSVHTRPPHRC